MDYRKANTDDVSSLVELRKSQLIDEGCYADNDIHEELQKYFMNSITNESLVLWVAERSGRIIATAGVCFSVSSKLFQFQRYGRLYYKCVY